MLVQTSLYILILSLRFNLIMGYSGAIIFY